MFKIFKSKSKKIIEELKKSQAALLSSNKELKEEKKLLAIELQKTVCEMSDQILTANSIIENQKANIDSLNEKVANLEGQAELDSCKMKILNEKIKSFNGKIGGLSSSNAKIERKYKLLAEEFENVNQILKQEQEEKKTLIEITTKQNEEIKRLKNKPNPPTKEELERDMLFHGRRNKRK